MKIIVQLAVAVVLTAMIAAALAGDAFAKVIIKGKTVIKGGRVNVK